MTRTLRAAFGLGIVIASASIAACATPKPTKELSEARSAYSEAQKSSAAKLVPDRVLSAKQALDRAESAFQEEPGSFEEKSLAYLAHREALMAMTLAGQAEATKSIEDADVEYKQLQDDYRKLSRKELADREAKLEKARRELEAKGTELDKERAARIAAESKYQAAMRSLEEIAKVREESRGMVITLSGAVLFTSGRSELLPIAREKLDKVAEVLQEQDPNKKFVVEGYTDSVGTEENNRRLSQDRADMVRNHLVSRGVPASQITAIGKGESSPVADNKSPEGRANNRRVEIVVN